MFTDQPETYEITCDMCQGTGTRRDITLADKVCSGGKTTYTCPNCRGAGIRTKVRLFTPEQVQYADDLRRAARSECDPNAPIPEWML